jgi:hypothetical protein
MKRAPHRLVHHGRPTPWFDALRNLTCVVHRGFWCHSVDGNMTGDFHPTTTPFCWPCGDSVQVKNGIVVGDQHGAEFRVCGCSYNHGWVLWFDRRLRHVPIVTRTVRVPTFCRAQFKLPSALLPYVTLVMVGNARMRKSPQVDEWVIELSRILPPQSIHQMAPAVPGP